MPFVKSFVHEDTNWSLQIEQSLPKSISEVRLQAITDEIARLSAENGGSFISEDWSAEETVQATLPITDTILNRWEGNFELIETDLSRIQSTFSEYALASSLTPFRNEQQIIQLIDTHAPPPDLSDYYNREAVDALIAAVDTSGEGPDLSGYLLRTDAFTQAAADLLYVRTDNFPTSIGTTSDVLRLIGSDIMLQIGSSTAASFDDYVDSRVNAAAVSWQSLTQSLVPRDNPNALTLGTDTNRWLHIYGIDLWGTRINNIPINNYLNSNVNIPNVDFSDVGEDILFDTVDDHDIGQSGTVTAGTGKASTLAFVSPGNGHRPDHVYAKFGKFQVIEGMPWSDGTWRIALEGTRMQFAGAGTVTHLTINWANTLHEMAPWLTQATADGRYLQSVPTAYSTTVDLENRFDGRYLQSVPAALTGITSIAGSDIAISNVASINGTPWATILAGGDGGEVVATTWQNIGNVSVTIVPNGAGTISWGSRTNYFGEGHFNTTVTSEVEPRAGHDTLQIGRTGATVNFVGNGTSGISYDDLSNKPTTLPDVTSIGGKTVSELLTSVPTTLPDVTSVGGVSISSIITTATTALDSVTSVGGHTIPSGGFSTGSGGDEWSDAVDSSLLPAAANNNTYDVGGPNQTFRDGVFGRNVFAGSFRSQSFRPTVTTGSALGASSTDGAFAEGYIQTLRATNISALAGTTLTVNNATLAGTPVLGATLTGTEDLGTSTTSLGTAHLTAVISDQIKPKTSAGSLLGTNGDRWETIYGVDGVFTQLRGHSEQLTFGTDDTSSQILSANASDTTARTNFHLAGFQFHGALEASQSNTGVSDYGRIGWLAQSLTADSRPWRVGVFRKFVVTDDNTDIFGTDLDDDSAYPPGVLLATRIQSSIRRGAGQGRFTDFLEIGVSNTSTDNETNRRQKLVGWWHIEEKGMRYGDANTPAVLYGIQGQIDGSWKFNDGAVIDLNGANATFNNVPSEWTATGTGTTVDWDDIPESIVMRSTLTDGYIGSNLVPWVRVYSPSIQAGGGNALSIGGRTETGSVNISRMGQPTTVAGSLSVSEAAQLSSTLNVTGTATFEGATSGISYNDLDDAPTGGSFTGGTVANDTTFSSNVTIDGDLLVTEIQSGSTTVALQLGGNNTEKLIVPEGMHIAGNLVPEDHEEEDETTQRLGTATDFWRAGYMGELRIMDTFGQDSPYTAARIRSVRGHTTLEIASVQAASGFQNIVFRDDLVPSSTETIGQTDDPWTSLYTGHIHGGTDTSTLSIGASNTGSVIIGRSGAATVTTTLNSDRVNVMGALQGGGATLPLNLGGAQTQKVVVDAANALEVNTISSHGTNQNLTIETVGTGKVRIEADVAGPENGTIEVDHTNIRETNRMIKIWEKVGAFTAAEGSVTTTYTVNGETKTVAEMQTLFADAQGVVIKFGAMRAGDTSRYHWSSETYWFDNDGMGGHFGGVSDRDVGYRPATTNGISANATNIGNINFAWDFIAQTFDIHGGDLGAGNRVEIWVRV